MTNLEKKIAAFKREAGDKSQYTPEQQKIYSAFTKVNGAEVSVKVTDCEGVTMNVKLQASKEVRKILLKHYRGEKGTVSGREILNMFDVMRTGSKSFNDGNYVYRKRYVKHGNVYFIVIKLFSNGKDAVLKSFYSNVGYK